MTSSDRRNLYDDLPLNCLRREVRILVVHKGRGDGPLECTLKTVSLDEEAASFHALSYVWGNSNKTTKIIVNNHSVAVTKSLAKCLEILRDHSVSHAHIFDQPALTIWADAVCINQEDLLERSQQVQMMGDIYSSARNVVIRLGDGDKHTDYALDMMNSTNFREGLWDLAFSGRRPCQEEIMVDVIFKQVLCKSKWWQRLWVRQEFILATKEPVFSCGAKMIPWDHLLRCFLWLPRSWNNPDMEDIWDDCRKKVASSLIDADTNNGIHPIALHRVRESFRQRRALPFCDIFQYLLQNSMVTDSRDLVYGLLGLLEQQDRDQIVIDYELEAMQIYQQVGYLLWKQHTEQTLSELLPRLNFHGVDNGYPSWVPDFASQPSRGWRDHRTIHARRPWRKQSEHPFKSGQSVLVLQGLTFDVVENVVTTPYEFDDIEEIFPILRDIEELLLEAINRSIPPHNPLVPLSGLKHEESVLQTLTKSTVETGDVFPGLDDEQVWARLMGRELRPPEIAMAIESGKGGRLFHRLSIMLKGKLLGRKVLVSEAGFVGIGEPQIEIGDVIAFIFGTTAPLVLRRYRDNYRIVGCAYVSGLMDPDLLDRYYDKMIYQQVTFNIV
ncbi:heterokaryon incompatibility protein-domain-containing protein [Dactylonectria macrodidyma]|uniref:Heterokaryon incompatibility protein-domain-containing protein n=1 Tax=Dactylonectria macrodidyma TaxID=307937 RepID=A0A9P9D1W3_9HYPO|nr:heterokaryon incompatibility protein-domain-containing protein [Dactylonectria macrodidyma]